jgi:hypothetical protein
LTAWTVTPAAWSYLNDVTACSKNHVPAAATVTTEGKRMSINVERVGNLMVQHYVEDVAERSTCSLVSLSDSIGPNIASRVKVVVIWLFTAEAIDSETTKFTNTVEVRTAPGYLEALDERGVPFEKASELTQQAVRARNAEETPLFAKHIERKAVAGRWR